MVLRRGLRETAVPHARRVPLASYAAGWAESTRGTGGWRMGIEGYDAGTMRALRQLGEEGLKRRRRRWVGCGVALLAGLMLRVWLIVRFKHVAGDTLLYGDIALNWLRHGVYGFSRMVNGVDAPRPTLIRLPGYPMFLAGCFWVFGMGQYWAVLAVQTVIDLWTCWLMGATAARIFGERARIPAVWMGALCPFTAIYVANPLTETLTLFCIAAAFYGMLRWVDAGGEVNRWVGVVGSVLAYAVLLRPEQGMLAACVVPGIGWIGYKAKGLRGLRGAALVALLTVVPLAPWALRNWRVFHVVQPLAPRYATDPGEENPYGFQRWYRTWAVEFASTEEIYWNYEGDEIRMEDLPERAFDSPEQLAETRKLFAEYNLTTTSNPRLDAEFDALAWERIRAKPLRYYVWLPVGRVLNMMFRPRAEALPLPLDWWNFQKHWRDSLILAGLGALNLGYFVVAVAGFVVFWRLPKVIWVDKVVLLSMICTLVLRCGLLLTIDNSETRYTLEFFPVLIVLGAGYLQRLSLNSKGFLSME